VQSTPSIKFNNFGCAREHRQLISGLNFKAKGGELIKVEGPNGSGKSTLLKSIAGLSRRFDGEIEFATSNPNVLYIGHEIGFSDRLSVVENLEFMATLRGFDVNQIPSAIDDLGLTLVEQQPLRHLSAGQRRRVGLSLLLLDKANYLLLDEPFNAIDKQGGERVYQLISRRIEQGDLVFITHHQDLHLPHRVLALDDFQNEIRDD